MKGFLIPFALIICVAATAIYGESRIVREKDFAVVAFRPITNYAFQSANKLFDVDLTNAIDSGIIAPVKGQTTSGYFTFTSTLNATQAGTYYYKIYYQNESYKMPDMRNGAYDTLAAENFYGSWEDTNIGFKKFVADKPGTYVITDSFRILGNPRNEKKYFGNIMHLTEADIVDFMATIKRDTNWMKSIHEKAVQQKMGWEEALRADAIYILKEKRHSGDNNHRWKRNPRMGSYSAMVVVANEKFYKTLPNYIVDIAKESPEGYFVNPFYFFKKKHKESAGVAIATTKNFIKLKATLKPENGVYVETGDYPGKVDSSSFKANCNCNDGLYRSAHFEQFFHGINKDFVLNTIPVSADVANDEYTRDDYHAAEKKYKPGDFSKNYIRITDTPCKTVVAKGNYIEIHNPGNPNPQQARKENVGIKTRHGFSYGKVTAKIKFPALINKTNVWTGITQAVWLLYQGSESWNNRRNSTKGYTKKGSHTADAERIKTLSYSEIDFEILKASQYWPKTSYYYNKPKEENAQLNDDITVTTTNWDLANPDPANYGEGIQRLIYKNAIYETHRWDRYYQALTTRHAVKQSEILEPEFYYYQIEWKPNEIIWRIGPSKDKMVVVGYMNDLVTSIPNNQMILVISQEYHLSDWWPPIPFKQELIPFPKNDLVGKVYEVEVE